MNKNFFNLLLLSFGVLTQSDSPSDEVPCEKLQDYGWWGGSYKTCLMQKTTSIFSTGFTIESERDESVEGLECANNKKILFLPENVNEKFPNLVGYDVGSCAIKTVSKNHFKELYMLKELYLGGNQIEKISRDTFEDLISLERVSLHGNKLKMLNGEAFSGLTKLKLAYLGRNICINKDFDDQVKITTLQRVVSEKCGFCNAVEDVNCEILQGMKRIEEKFDGKSEKLLNEILQKQKQQNQVSMSIEALIAKMVNEIANKTLEITELKTKLTEAENEIAAKTKEINECREELSTTITLTATTTEIIQ